MLVDVAFERKFKRVITLDELKDTPTSSTASRCIARGNRLSVMPVTAAQWRSHPGTGMT